MAAKKASPGPAAVPGLRITDRETARVVVLQHADGTHAGSGCLLDGRHILTCHHVLDRVPLEPRVQVGDRYLAKLVGVSGRPVVPVEVIKLGGDNAGRHIEEPIQDIALLTIVGDIPLNVPAMEFATPLHHAGKKYSVLGFPSGSVQGRTASGVLNAADAMGLVQMDQGGPIAVISGFSGAPVWSPDIGAFAGIVVTELRSHQIAWCIPSQILCRFHPEIPVRFRMPPSDRPPINDRSEDDPNLELFGPASEANGRRLTARVVTHGRGNYKAHLIYECLPGSPPPRGKYVTFVLHADYEKEEEDAYELFSVVKKNGRATNWFELDESFTVAAIGDGCDTHLVLNLAALAKKPKGFS